MKVKEFYKDKYLGGWYLFSGLAFVVCLFNFFVMFNMGLDEPHQVSHMISYSVRWAVPFIYAAMMASSMKILFPSNFSRWWLKNRKYIGLVFGVGMAWQALFIFILSNYYRDYYYSEVFYFRDELEGSVGYLFLIAMIATSFKKIASLISSGQWKLIQKSGLYFLWAYAFSVYWWNLFYYPFEEGGTSPRLIDYIFYWLGFVACLIRIMAWGKVRYKSVNKNQTISLRFFGYFLIFLGLLMSGTGHLWLEMINNVTLYYSWSQEMSLWLPFWPLEPFFSLSLIGLGTLIISSGNRSIFERKMKLQSSSS